MSDVMDDVWEAGLPPWQRESSPPMAGDVPYELPEFCADDAALIDDVVRDRIGLFAVAVPALPYPLWVRGGTADAATCRAVFLAGDGDPRIPYRPRRILEIGAGAGYRSVALARRHADAQILAVEPDPAFARLARLNTLPYQNISFVDGPVTAASLQTLLGQHGWDFYDTVVITPDEVSVTLLRAAWPPGLRLVALRVPEAALPPGALAAFDGDVFERRQQGPYPQFFRRAAQDQFAPPLPLPLFDPLGLPGGFSRAHVPEAPSYFFPIHPYGLRLHPKPAPQPPPVISVVRPCAGQKQLFAKLAVGHGSAAPIRFTIIVAAVYGGEELARLDCVVAGGSVSDATAPLKTFFGPCRVSFSTAMAEPGASTNFGWANFLDARFI